MLAGSSPASDGHFAVLLAGGSDGNLHVLSKRGQEFHQPANWKTPGPVAHEQGDVRLFDAERHGGFGQRHAALLDDISKSGASAEPWQHPLTGAARINLTFRKVFEIAGISDR
jgi:hypothetical protein